MPAEGEWGLGGETIKPPAKLALGCARVLVRSWIVPYKPRRK